MGKSQKAPQAYNPTGQAQADQNYQNLVSNATPYATSLPQQVVPGLQQVTSNIQNNPYYAGSMQGAQAASAAGTGQVAPGMLQGNQNLQSLGNLSTALGPWAALEGMQMAGGAYGQGQNIYNQAQGMLPNVTGGTQYADPLMQSLTGMIPQATQAGLQTATPAMLAALGKAGQSWDAIMGGGGLQTGMDAAGRVLGTGFDPQSQLYDREYQRTMDQQNAINAMYGVSGSPYGAGTAGDASRNFNIDWQNQQLQRQIAALGAYGQEQGVYGNLVNSASSDFSNLLGAGVGAYTGLTGNAANNAATLANAGVGAYTGLTGNAANNFSTVANTGLAGLNSGVQNYNALMGGGIDRLSALTGNAGSAYATGGALGTDALNTLYQAGQLPNQTFLQQQQQQLAALQALSSGTASALAPTQAMMDANANYLKLGQSATQLNQNAAQINNQAQSSLMSSIGSIAGLAMAPFTGGASLGTALGLFGLGGAAKSMASKAG